MEQDLIYTFLTAREKESARNTLSLFFPNKLVCITQVGTAVERAPEVSQLSRHTTNEVLVQRVLDRCPFAIQRHQIHAPYKTPATL